MKYSEYHSRSRRKGNTAFYVIIACCLLAIGGAAWFAAANINRADKHKTESGMNSFVSSITSKINSIASDPMPTPSKATPSVDVGNNVSDEPYSSAEKANSEPKEKEPAAVVFSMPVQGEIIKKYSEKELQYSATYGDMRVHSGIDIACEEATAVSAAGNGKVLSVEENALLGNVVAIDHGNGIVTKYASLKNVKIKAGDTVSAGDIIGTVTAIPGECADQSHLHLEVLKNGHPAAPLSVFGLE